MGDNAAWSRLGPGVLAPLTRYPHVIRLPYGTAGMAHPCAAPPSARIPAGYPGILTLFSAAKCLPPKRHQPAIELNCVLLKKNTQRQAIAE